MNQNDTKNLFKKFKVLLVFQKKKKNNLVCAMKRWKGAFERYVCNVLCNAVISHRGTFRVGLLFAFLKSKGFSTQTVSSQCDSKQDVEREGTLY